MTNESEVAPDDDVKVEPRKPVQFSLRAIMIVTLFVCILCVPGGAYWFDAIYRPAATAALGVACWKGRGWIRIFAICGLVPHIPLILGILNQRADSLQSAFFGLIAGLSGAACARYLQKRDGLAPVPNIPIIRNWLSN